MSQKAGIVFLISERQGVIVPPVTPYLTHRASAGHWLRTARARRGQEHNELVQSEKNSACSKLTPLAHMTSQFCDANIIGKTSAFHLKTQTTTLTAAATVVILDCLSNDLGRNRIGGGKRISHIRTLAMRVRMCILDVLI